MSGAKNGISFLLAHVPNMIKERAGNNSPKWILFEMQILPIAAIYFMTHLEDQVCYFSYFITSVSPFLFCMHFSIAIFYFFLHSSYLCNFSRIMLRKRVGVMMWVLQRVWLSFYMPCGRYLAPIVGAYLTDVFFKCGVHNTSFFLSFESRAVGNITKCYRKYIILFNFPKPFFFIRGNWS